MSESTPTPTASSTPRYGLPPTPEYLAMMEQRRSDAQTILTKIFADPATAAKPFTWELGSGHGHFLTAYAQAHPEKLCIGVDIIGERVERAERKRDRAKLANLHFLQAEATLFLRALPLGLAFSELFILFPDPWPKARHHKHRIIQPEFLKAAATRAAPNCRLCFRTDYRPYFEDARATIAGVAEWEITEEPWPFEYETVFQQRAVATGHDSLIARRRGATL
jgi:tRNA (guanine-N7-)-methyltransferase